MTTMNMTCVCTTEVTSIVLMPSTSRGIVTSTTTTTLSNGEVLGGETSSVDFSLPKDSTIVADIIALAFAGDAV